MPTCKNCFNSYTKSLRRVWVQNPEYVEKQRLLRRKSYHAKDGYKSYQHITPEAKKNYTKKYKERYPEKELAYQSISHMTRKPNINRHHWSYKVEHHKNIIELNMADHKKAHRFLIYDPERMMYRRTDNNELLDTKERHEAYIFDCIKNKE